MLYIKFDEFKILFICKINIITQTNFIFLKYKINVIIFWFISGRK